MRIIDPLLMPYIIEVDENQYTIVEEIEIKNAEKSKRVGETRESVIGHYSNLGWALKKIARLQILSKEDMLDLEEYITMYQNIMKEFTKKFNL